jgi:hypothetical protein
LFLNLWAAAAIGEDLPKNAGFEKAADSGVAVDWSGPATVYNRDTAVHRSGDASLKYVNADPAVYVLCSQPVELAQGKMYEISAWVKTQDITGEESGATICVEWYDAAGKWAGGCYPQGVKGTADWTLVKGVTPRIPPEAAKCSLSCYVRQGMTGTAWWDDVSVVPHAERPFASVLVSPNYRSQVLGPNPDPIRIRCFINLTDYPLQLGDVLLAWRVVNAADQAAVVEGEMGSIKDVTADVVIDGQSLSAGRYSVEVVLKPKRGGDVLAVDTWSVSRVLENPQRTACIDGHNRLILNGEPFFPLGMYWGGVKAEELDIYAQSAFNCLMPYAELTKDMLDLAEARGLKIIASVKNSYFGTDASAPGIKSQDDELPYVKSYVEALRDHPALLAWYINDELPLDMLDHLSAHRQWIEDLDPNHPAWVVLYQVDQIREYLPSYDVIGTDPYPIPERPPATAGDYARKMSAALCGSRAMWQVPQVFNWANYRKTEAEKSKSRPPSLEEMRSMAWQSIAEGATGIVFYSWFDLRRDPATPFDEQWMKVKTVALEIKEMIPVLLSVESPPKVAVETAPWLNSLVKQRDGVTYAVLVNNGAEAQTARLTLPSAPESITSYPDGKPFAVSGEGKAVELAMEPLAVHVLKIQWKP